MGKFSLDDYIPVNERLGRFWSDHPKGRIDTQMSFPTGPDRVYIVASVYREADDLFPAATGTSQMVIPGTTPYTKNAEVEVAETSAVGRALALMGYEVNKAIASREEVAKNQPSTNSLTVPGDVIEGFVTAVATEAISLKAGSTTYEVPCDPSGLAVGEKVRVTGSIQMVPWKKDGKAMPPRKRINAVEIEAVA